MENHVYNVLDLDKCRAMADRAEKRPRLYIAGPMTSSGDPYANVGHAIRVANVAWARGWAPFVPHLDVLWSMSTPDETPDWLEWDLNNLRTCDAICRIPGKSYGGDVEVWYAGVLEMPLYTPDTIPFVGQEAAVREQAL